MSLEKTQTDQINEPLAFKVEDAARTLQLDPRTVRDMFKRGELIGNQRGKIIRLNRASVIAWLSGKSGSRSWRNK